MVIVLSLINTSIFQRSHDLVVLGNLVLRTWELSSKISLFTPNLRTGKIHLTTALCICTSRRVLSLDLNHTFFALSSNRPLDKFRWLNAGTSWPSYTSSKSQCQINWVITTLISSKASLHVSSLQVWAGPSSDASSFTLLKGYPRFLYTSQIPTLVVNPSLGNERIWIWEEALVMVQWPYRTAYHRLCR